MGSLITFVSAGHLHNTPTWLEEKWRGVVAFVGPQIICTGLQKSWHDFEMDLVAAIQQSTFKTEICITYLYECGNVDRSFIDESGIVHAEPTGWKRINALRSHNAWDECVPMMRRVERITGDGDLSHVPYPQ